MECITNKADNVVCLVTNNIVIWCNNLHSSLLYYIIHNHFSQHFLTIAVINSLLSVCCDVGVHGKLKCSKFKFSKLSVLTFLI